MSNVVRRKSDVSKVDPTRRRKSGRILEARFGSEVDK